MRFMTLCATTLILMMANVTYASSKSIAFPVLTHQNCQAKKFTKGQHYHFSVVADNQGDYVSLYSNRVKYELFDPAGNRLPLDTDQHGNVSMELFDTTGHYTFIITQSSYGKFCLVASQL